MTVPLRLRFDNVSDLGGTNTLTFADDSTTTGTWESAPALPTIAAPYVVPIVVNPNTADVEIAWLTAYTEGDLTGTFDRGQEDTTPAAATAAPWFNGPTTFDWSFPTFEGSGNPEGSVIGQNGYSYADVNNGGLYIFQGTPGDDTGWQQVGGSTEVATGGVFTGSEAGIMSSKAAGFTLFGDLWWFVGEGNGLLYTKDGTDGHQAMHLQLGGSNTWHWNADGTADVPGPLTLDTTVDGGSVTVFAYTADPNGHVTALAKGDICFETATPGVWQAGAADDSSWVQVGAPGTGGDIAGITQADAPTTQAADGSEIVVQCTVAAPPSWMDDAGNITEPGLYAVAVLVEADVAPTTPGLFVNVLLSGEAFPSEAVALDSLAGGQSAPTAVLALGEADVPYLVNMGIQMPTDVTASVVLTPIAWLLSDGTGGGGGGGGGSFPDFTGSGSPEGSQTATVVGQTYQDTTTGAIYFYNGTPPSDTGWWAGATVVEDFGTTAMSGIGVNTALSVLEIVGPPDGGGVRLTDSPGAFGSGDGIYLNSTGTDGGQTIEFLLGDAAFEWDFTAAGLSEFPGPILIDRNVDGGSSTIYAFDGSPVGSVTPNQAGDICIDSSTPALWQATSGGGGIDTAWVMVGSGGGGGGGGGSVGDLADLVFADSGTTLSGDGSTTEVDPFIAAPPPWMDDAGHITAPGLYAYGVAVQQLVAPATPGEYIDLFPEQGFAGQAQVSCDSLATGEQQVMFTLALGAADLPFNAGIGVTMPTDGALTVSVTGVVYQLATGSGGIGDQTAEAGMFSLFVNLDGTPVTQAGGPTSGEPTWMDDAGNITAPGLYMVESILSNFQSPTTPGLLLSVETGSNDFGQTIQIYAYDDLFAAGFGLSQSFVLALGPADLPYPSSTRVNQIAVTDATAGFDLTTVTFQLATGAGSGGGGSSYGSLTGGASSGDALTQTGDLIVDGGLSVSDDAGDGITLATIGGELELSAQGQDLTIEITKTGSGVLALSNANTGGISLTQSGASGGINLTTESGGGPIELNSDGGDIDLSAAGEVNISGADFILQMDGDTFQMSQLGSGGIIIIDEGTGADTITLPNLPSADPHNVGQLWNNAGIVNVSAG
jgi:hypothetical protein